MLWLLYLTRQACVLSMAVRKLMKPETAVTFSRKLVLNQRNGQPCLQARITNLRGTLLTNVQVSMSCLLNAE